MKTKRKEPKLPKKLLSTAEMRKQMKEQGRIEGIINLTKEEVLPWMGSRDDFYDYLALKLCGTDGLMEIEANYVDPDGALKMNEGLEVEMKVSGNAWWLEKKMEKTLKQIDKGEYKLFRDGSYLQIRDEDFIEIDDPVINRARARLAKKSPKGKGL
jgi:hypothetical protein